MLLATQSSSTVCNDRKNEETSQYESTRIKNGRFGLSGVGVKRIDGWIVFINTAVALYKQKRPDYYLTLSSLEVLVNLHTLDTSDILPVENSDVPNPHTEVLVTSYTPNLFWTEAGRTRRPCPFLINAHLKSQLLMRGRTSFVAAEGLGYMPRPVGILSG